MADTPPTDPAPPPANPPADPPAPPANPPAPPAEPAVTFKTQDEFNRRLEQAKRSAIKEAGAESPEDLARILEEHKKLQAAAEEQRQKDMSELEREREARAKYEQEAREAAERAEEAEHRAHMMSVFASKGVKNTDYAYWKTVQALSALDDDGELDVGEFVDGLLADGREREALGIAQASTVGVTDTPVGRDVQPPGAGAPPRSKSIKDMSPEEFRAHSQAQYGYIPGQ